MKPAITLLACLCLFFSSCRTRSASAIEKEYLSALLKDYHFTDATEWVIILPGLGCHGCIQEGEAFMKDYVKSKNTSFILTRVESLKILFQKTGVKPKEGNNIIIDSAGTIKIPTNNVVYPCIIHLKNGQYLEHAFQSPQNSNAFNQLKMLLAKNDE